MGAVVRKAHVDRLVRVVCLLAITTLALAACARVGQGPGPETSPFPAEAQEPEGLTLQMLAQNDSGQEGTAVLTSTPDGKTRIIIDLANSPAGPQPSTINSGTCANLGDTVHVLGGMRGGKLDTEAVGHNVEASLDSLLAGQFAINVSRSPQDFGVSVSCADIRV